MKKLDKRAIVALGLVVLIVFGLYYISKTMNTQQITTDSPNIEDDKTIGSFEVGGKQEEQSDNTNKTGEIKDITFAGFGRYEVSKDNPKIELRNPENNFADFIFTITDKESKEIIARTDKVKSGDYAYVDITDYYNNPGTYTIIVDTSTFDHETGTEMNGLSQDIEVIVY